MKESIKFSPEVRERAVRHERGSGQRVDRYDFELWRHWSLVNAWLAKHRRMLGDTHTLVDMAVQYTDTEISKHGETRKRVFDSMAAYRGWGRAMPFVLGADA